MAASARRDAGNHRGRPSARLVSRRYRRALLMLSRADISIFNSNVNHFGVATLRPIEHRFREVCF
jgi:hypothetical protein